MLHKEEQKQDGRLLREQFRFDLEQEPESHQQTWHKDRQEQGPQDDHQQFSRESELRSKLDGLKLNKDQQQEHLIT
jgi:hypothetical protein